MPRKPRIEYSGACYHVMSRGDRQAYRKYLQERYEEVLKERRRTGEKRVAVDEWTDLRRGWYLGNLEFKEKLLGMIEEVVVGKGKSESFGGWEMEERGEEYAARLLEKCVKELGIIIEKLRSMRKNELRKQAVAWLLRTRTGVKNEWIQKEIGMGHRNNISLALPPVERGKDREMAVRTKKIMQCAD